MRLKAEKKRLRVVGLAFLLLLMLLASHMAYSPYNLLPTTFRWGLYPVAPGNEEAPLTAGSLVLCDKNSPAVPGALVAWITARPSSAGEDEAICYFGRVSGEENALYTVDLNMAGELVRINTYSPQRVISQTKGLGSVVFFFHSNRVLVWIICLSLLLGYGIYRAATARRRNMIRTREGYIQLFDQYGNQFNEEDDF